jgi:hypothetical protein
MISNRGLWVVTACSDVIGYHLHSEDGGGKVFRNSVSNHITTHRHNPEDHDLNYKRRRCGPYSVSETEE